jgi:hypothetical protein
MAVSWWLGVAGDFYALLGDGCRREKSVRSLTSITLLRSHKPAKRGRQGNEQAQAGRRHGPWRRARGSWNDCAPQRKMLQN